MQRKRYVEVDQMKLLAATFGGIALLAALLGFAMNVAPIVSLCGKMAAVVAMCGLACTAGASTTDDAIPAYEFDAQDIHY